MYLDATAYRNFNFNVFHWFNSIEDKQLKVIFKLHYYVNLIDVSGTSKPRPQFRWTEDHSIIREANRTQVPIL
jgi:hypothetical protein